MPDEIIAENYESPTLVKMWREFINWEKRRAGEGNFLINQFQKYQVKKVFDASLGDGCDSIYLLKQGFEVTSNEIDKLFLAQALVNAQAEGVHLTTTTLDWRILATQVAAANFDAVICLGNSITYLFTAKEQLKALDQFKRILHPGGILIIDERNYQYILDHREAILQGDFRYSGKYVYCGEKIHGKPVEITDTYIKMEYTQEDSPKKGYLIMYPFKRGELKNLLTQAGFTTVEQFSDYKISEDTNADFYQYVCVK